MKIKVNMEPRKQSGAIPYRIKNGQIQIMLVHTVRNNNWGFPKGGLEPDISKKENAAKEALEEAGIVGKTGSKVGEYTYIKGKTKRRQHVRVYLLKVSKTKKNYLESGQRKRKWFTPEKAKNKLNRQLGVILDRGIREIRKVEKLK